MCNFRIHNVTEKLCHQSKKKTKNIPCPFSGLTVSEQSSRRLLLVPLRIPLVLNVPKITRGLLSFLWIFNLYPAVCAFTCTSLGSLTSLTDVLLIYLADPTLFVVLHFHRFVLSLGAGNMRCSPRRRGLGWALVGAQQHLVLGGVLCATALLFHQELFESAGGEGERLSPQLHQVGVLQPGLCEAVSGSRTGPGITQTVTFYMFSHWRKCKSKIILFYEDYIWLFLLLS